MRFRPEHEPDHEGAGRDDQHDRDEDRADPVGQTLDGGLGALGALDEVHDLGEGRVPTHPGRAHDERPGRVDGRPDDLVTDGLGGRDRLAGQHRLVDGGRALDEEAVDRDLVAGPDAQQVAHEHLLQRHLDLVGAAHDPGGPSLQADETPDRARRLAFGPAFQPPTQQDQAQDDRRRVEVGLWVEPGLVDELRIHRHEHAVRPGRGRADDDEGVHGRAAVPPGAPRGAVEAGAGPELDERGGPQDELVDVLHRHDGLWPEHQDHDPDGGRERDHRLDERVAEVAGAIGRLPIGGLVHVRPGSSRRRSHRPAVA